MGLPLVSCLMATQAGRLEMFRDAVEDFRKQTHGPRELVIVSSSPAVDMQAYQAHVQQLADPRVQYYQLDQRDGAQLPLGAMRNRANERATGEFRCLWDDDDRHHPERLEAHYRAIVSAKADASFLWEQLHFFTEERELYLLNWYPHTVPGILMYRQTELQNLETGPKAYKGEDRVFFDAYKKQGGRIVGVAKRPDLYLRIFHGANNTNRKHHLQLAQQRSAKISELRLRRDLIVDSLRLFGITSPVAVRDRHGVAFSY